uniref:J domain-containing protein n=1 Tax=Setaria italica TaxID=4555 RepID=K4AK53_SETIT
MADAATTKEEQARKAHALAEKCFLAGNVHGARQWMQSAVRLAPGLPGTAQIVAAYDVHAAAARRRPPDSWYAVLDLHPAGPTITHDDVKRQYRRLCLLVHPDKNPCPAADGAFKLVQAAWDALSAGHPPGAAPPAAAKQPPRPPQQRQQAPPPWPRPRPTVVQMPRRAAPAPARAAPRAGATRTPSYAQQATGQKPPPPTTGRRCPACGACTINGRRSFRCGSCQWSSMYNRPPDDDDDDDFFEEDNY